MFTPPRRYEIDVTKAVRAWSRGEPAHGLALRGDGYAVVYTPLGRPLDVALDKLGFDEVRACWFDPRTGRAAQIGRFAQKNRHAFTPPTPAAEGNDWVLMLDDARRTFPSPSENAGGTRP